MKDDLRKGVRYSLIASWFGYLSIQAFMLLLVSLAPWPVVDVLVFIATSRQSVTPDPVLIFFWVQFAIGVLLPIRGKVFLMGQFVFFATVFFYGAEVVRPRGFDEASLTPSLNSVYWIQFFASAFGYLAWLYRRTPLRPWYPVIVYSSVQVAIGWVITRLGWPINSEIRALLGLIFVAQALGLLLVPGRARLLVTAEILVGVLLAHFGERLRFGQSAAPDSLSDAVWVVYILQAVGLLVWWLSRQKDSPTKLRSDAGNTGARSAETRIEVDVGHDDGAAERLKG